ncbi:MAG: DUF4384 domain-containing protein [Acidobacteria bacterium]|nr:DUF4384 domain-containing protein [Acidobacteriota bacterium]
MTKRISLFVAILSLLSFAQIAHGQDTRGILPEEFIKARKAKAKTANPAARRNLYRKATGSAQHANAGNFAQLGLTIWRLRPARTTDTGARIIVHQEAETIEWTPERIAANTPLSLGERLRFSFEAPRAGYLYVIDREQYADGSMGEPSLIFPTLRTRGGDNHVEPGKLIEIPGQDDRPNYFTLRQSRADQAGELLTVIVVAQPLPGLEIGTQALSLSPTQVRQWEQQWGAQTETFEMAGGAGKAWTKAEQEAGAGGTRQLTQEEPGPQTIYRVAVKPDAPLLVKVGLRYGQATRKPRR